MRKITIDLDEILSIVSCAEDYGFADDVLLDTLADWTGRRVSDNEIAKYADGLMSEENQAKGYGEEDRDDAIRRLTEWRDRYCKPRKATP